MVSCPNCQHEFEPTTLTLHMTPTSAFFGPVATASGYVPTVITTVIDGLGRAVPMSGACIDCGATFPTCAERSISNPYLCTTCEQKAEAIDAS